MLAKVDRSSAGKHAAPALLAETAKPAGNPVLVSRVRIASNRSFTSLSVLMKPLKLTIIILGSLAALLALVVVLALTPAVQTLSLIHI